MNYRGKKKSGMICLLKYLMENSDEDHPCKAANIRADLASANGAEYALSKDRIIKYRDQLKDDLGIDIAAKVGLNGGYYIGERLLSVTELKLIIDAINTANFIDPATAVNIADKLKRLVSKYKAEELDRSVMAMNVAKMENDKILENVDIIQKALSNKVQISFDYMAWNKNKELVKTSKSRYTMNPWTLIWAYDRYYLYGYDVDRREGVLAERNYRVDKMSNIEISEVKRGGEEQFKSFDITAFASRRQGMFTGKEQIITVRIKEKLIGAFIDQFGKNDIIAKVNVDDTIDVTFRAVPSVIFLGWIVGLEDAKIISPPNVVEKMVELINHNEGHYR